MDFMIASYLLLALVATADDEPKPASKLGSPPPAKSATATPGNQSRRIFLPSDPRDEAAILAEDAQIPREKQPTGPTAPLSLFGSAQAEGRSFVLLLDRSASMGSGGIGAIQAAAKELTTRLGTITDKQTLQIIAYNQQVEHLEGRELVPATEENKRRLIKRVADLSAAGQTEHHYGLLAALRLKPEVIFLLTDGGDPVMKPSQLRLIRELAGARTAIHCIRFGRGPESDPMHFMARLASENRGSYVYVDVNAR
jgi:hypothetical protein